MAPAVATDVAMPSRDNDRRASENSGWRGESEQADVDEPVAGVQY
jgi:hypothetical protein